MNSAITMTAVRRGGFVQIAERGRSGAVGAAVGSPRLSAPLRVVTGVWLYGEMGDDARLAEMPCAGGLLPVVTSRGLRGIEPEEWDRYCRIREAVRVCELRLLGKGVVA